jgi:hypothetical protein
VIERGLGLGDPAEPMSRRLELACALVHTLVARTAGDAPAGGQEALALLEELALPAAVFDAGARAPRLVNGAWRALIGARRGAALEAHVDEVIRTGATIHLPELELALGSRPAYCAATLRPIRDGDGARSGAIVLCALITDEVIARRLAVSADTLVWGGPLSGGPNYCNRAWRAYTGNSAESSSHRTWQDAIHAGDLPRCMQALSELTRLGRAEVEARMRRADGAYRWHRLRFVIEAAEPRWFGTATDIDHAHAEAEHAECLARERAARGAAEQASRHKDQFLASLSHELRTPLTTMLLWEQVLRDETATAALRAQALEAIHQSALAQSRMVGDLLDVSRAINGKLRVDLRPLDIKRVLREALEAIAPAALAKQITLDRRGPPVVAEVQGDDTRLRQVLDNLLANAVKFTEPGGRITVAVACQDRSIAIDITDTGRGIAPELLPRVFEPFSQLDDSLPRGDSGLGLGLAIAKQLVALHGGELTAASAGPGHGATFTVKLPLAADRERAGSPSIEHARRPMLDRLRVLVVDDDQRVRDALALLLERAGAVVETAESAAAARERVALRAPEALVCDIAMPGEDGNSFIRDLRASGRDIPAIALTAYAMESDVEKALAAGFDLHVAKPVDIEHLVAEIGELVAARRADART